MLEGGQYDPKDMIFIMQSGVYAFFSFRHFGHGLLGDMEEKRALTMVLFPHLKGGQDSILVPRDLPY